MWTCWDMGRVLDAHTGAAASPEQTVHAGTGLSHCSAGSLGGEVCQLLWEHQECETSL